MTCVIRYDKPYKCDVAITQPLVSASYVQGFPKMNLAVEQVANPLTLFSLQLMMKVLNVVRQPCGTAFMSILKLFYLYGTFLIVRG